MVNVYRHIGWFIKENWKLYLLALLMLLTVSIVPVFPARYLARAIDAIVGGTLTKSELIIDLAAIFGFPVIDYVVNIGYHYIINLLGQNVSFSLRERYINHLFELDQEAYEKYTKGDLIARATNDLQNITTAATTFLHQVVYYTTTIIAAFVMMILINPVLAIASTFFMPPLIFWLDKRRQKERTYYTRHQEIFGAMTENVLESIEAVKTVRAYGKEDMDFARTKVAIDNDNASWWHILKFETLYSPFFEAIYALSYGVALALGVMFVVNSVISTGELLSFLVYIAMFYGPLVGLASILNSVSVMTVSDERFHEIMALEPVVKDAPVPLSVPSFTTIEFRHVSFRYPFDDFDVIEDISFTIHRGETIGIVGPTGAGKSTLIRQLLRQFKITGGDIYVDGRPIEDCKIDDMRALVGYVPQDAMLFRRSVDENILLGNPQASMVQVRQAIHDADFTKDLASLPQGESTLVSELGSSLSGGQKQRLAIARALVRDPEILILDDSLSAVDALTESAIIRNLKADRAGRTNIIIAHRFSAIAHADQVIVLEHGRITQSGSPDELLRTDGWYKTQYIHQVDASHAEERLNGAEDPRHD